MEEDTIKQAVIKRKEKSTLEKRESFSNKTLLQKSHQRNKHLGSTPCKILVTILRFDKGRTQTNRPKNKKADDHTLGLTPER